MRPGNQAAAEEPGRQGAQRLFRGWHIPTRDRLQPGWTQPPESLRQHQAKRAEGKKGSPPGRRRQVSAGITPHLGSPRRAAEPKGSQGAPTASQDRAGCRGRPQPSRHRTRRSHPGASPPPAEPHRRSSGAANLPFWPPAILRGSGRKRRGGRGHRAACNPSGAGEARAAGRSSPSAELLCCKGESGACSSGAPASFALQRRPSQPRTRGGGARRNRVPRPLQLSQAGERGGERQRAAGASETVRPYLGHACAQREQPPAQPRWAGEGAAALGSGCRPGAASCGPRAGRRRLSLGLCCRLKEARGWRSPACSRGKSGVRLGFPTLLPRGFGLAKLASGPLGFRAKIRGLELWHTGEDFPPGESVWACRAVGMQQLYRGGGVPSEVTGVRLNPGRLLRGKGKEAEFFFSLRQAGSLHSFASFGRVATRGGGV